MNSSSENQATLVQVCSTDRSQEEPFTDDESISEPLLPLSPPDHILKKLTPIGKRFKRRKTAAVSTDSEEDAESLETAIDNRPTDPSSKRKSRLLSLSEVKEKVERQKIQKQIETENRKREMKLRLENARHMREELITKKSERARRFSNNMEIWRSFKLKFADYENSSLSNDVTAGKSEHIQSEIIAIHPSIGTLERSGGKCYEFRHDEVAAVKVIKRYVRKYKFKKISRALYKHRMFSSSSLDEAYGDFKKSVNPEEIFENRGLLYFTQQILNLLDIPEIKASPSSSFPNYHLFRIAGASCLDLYSETPQTSSYFFNSSLGADAISEYGGFNFPKFMKNQYSNDKFCEYLVKQSAVAARSALIELRSLIRRGELADFRDPLRRRFMIRWSEFVSIYRILANHEISRLILVFMKILDKLQSLDSIYKHRLQSSSDPDVDAHDIERTKSLMKTLTLQKQDFEPRLQALLEARRSFIWSYSQSVNVWYTKGTSIDSSIEELVKTFISSNIAFSDEYADILRKTGVKRLIIPSGFTVMEWRRFNLLKALDILEKHEYDSHIPRAVFLKSGKSSNAFKLIGQGNSMDAQLMRRTLGKPTYEAVGIQLMEEIDRVGDDLLTIDICRKVVKLSQNLINTLGFHNEKDSGKALGNFPVLSELTSGIFSIKFSDFQTDRMIILRSFIFKVITILQYFIEYNKAGEVNPYLTSSLTGSLADMVTSISTGVSRAEDFSIDCQFLKKYIRTWSQLMDLFVSRWIKVALSELSNVTYPQFESLFFHKQHLQEQSYRSLTLKVSNIFFAEDSIVAGQLSLENGYEKVVKTFVVASIFQSIESSSSSYKRLLPPTFETYMDELGKVVKELKSFVVCKTILLGLMYFLENMPLILPFEAVDESLSGVKRCYLINDWDSIASEIQIVISHSKKTTTWDIFHEVLLSISSIVKKEAEREITSRLLLSTNKITKEGKELILQKNFSLDSAVFVRFFQKSGLIEKTPPKIQKSVLGWCNRDICDAEFSAICNSFGNNTLQNWGTGMKTVCLTLNTLVDVNLATFSAFYGDVLKLQDEYIRLTSERAEP